MSKEFMNQNPAYELLGQEFLADYNSQGIVLRHKKSGAHVCLVSNEDNNKVFCIGFKTIPRDSTGVPHIIEHTVLCGSEKFPLKDPFIELCKGSLNTFLNAMTYPDRTIYPVASCNEKDFQNLMHVYMDAVFKPNIYHTDNIFKQEGWHYELESPEAELKINGVVYNEMKGALSSADEVLYQAIQTALYPDNTYAVNSGGDPSVIPELTYEQYLDFHRTYYHPSNSYIYLYGDMDMAEKLVWLDENYLASFDAMEVDADIPMQKPLGFSRICEEYSIGEEESTDKKAMLSYSTIIGDFSDLKRILAWDVLTFVLFQAPGAPVKQALIDAGIGADVSGEFMSYLKQPALSIIAREADAKQEEQFLAIIQDTLKKLTEEGLNRKSLLGAISSQEFRYRESDYGTTPPGLMMILNIYCTWLYDETQVFPYCRRNGIFEELRKEIDTGYFEKLIREDVLESKHTVSVTLVPKQGLSTRKDRELAEKLAAYKASLTEAEILRIVEETKALRAYQEEETTEEQLSCLPLLEISDLEVKVEDASNLEHKVEDVTVVHHDIFTNGISYIQMLFDATDVPASELPYLGLLSGCLGMMDTGNYSYAELTDECNIYTGGLGFSVETYSDRDSTKDFRGFLGVSARVLRGNTDKALELIREVLCRTKFGDVKRIREIIAEGCTRLKARFESAGHSVALSRGLSYFSPQEYYRQQTGGIDFYYVLKDILENYDAKKDEIERHLTRLLWHILKKERMIIGVTGDTASYETLAAVLPAFLADIAALPKGEALPARTAYPLTAKNEAFTFAGQVQYLAVCGNYKDAGIPFSGAIRVMRNILSMDYLWTNVRVLGGAYGCMCDFNPVNGNAFFVSYRDPKLAETKEVYEKAADYIENMPLSEREMTKYIIGTISNDYPPFTPKMRGTRDMSLYMTGRSADEIRKCRDEILATTPEDIHKAAEVIRGFVSQGYICVVGSEASVSACRDIFHEVKQL